MNAIIFAIGVVAFAILMTVTDTQFAHALKCIIITQFVLIIISIVIVLIGVGITRLVDHHRDKKDKKTNDKNDNEKTN